MLLLFFYRGLAFLNNSASIRHTTQTNLTAQFALNKFRQRMYMKCTPDLERPVKIISCWISLGTHFVSRQGYERINARGHRPRTGQTYKLVRRFLLQRGQQINREKVDSLPASLLSPPVLSFMFENNHYKQTLIEPLKLSPIRVVGQKNVLWWYVISSVEEVPWHLVMQRPTRNKPANL